MSTYAFFDTVAAVATPFGKGGVAVIRLAGTDAAAVAARLGYVKKSADITVKVRGGDLTVSFDGDHVLLTGGVRTVFEGTVEI